MLDRESALQIALGDLDLRCTIDDAGVAELREGWYFPNNARVGGIGGSHGVIVNKATGKIFRLGSAFPPERDLYFYDRGFQFDLYDLVIVEVDNVEATLDSLVALGLKFVQPTYEHGSVWRVPRTPQRSELAACISRLPYVFGEVSLYFGVEVLEEARTAGHFRFEALECSSRRRSGVNLGPA
jgi:hypothetical protein